MCVSTVPPSIQLKKQLPAIDTHAVLYIPLMIKTNHFNKLYLSA